MKVCPLLLLALERTMIKITTMIAVRMTPISAPMTPPAMPPTLAEPVAVTGQRGRAYAIKLH